MGIHFIDILSHFYTKTTNQKMYKLVISVIFLFAVALAEPGHRRYCKRVKYQKPDLVDTAIKAGSFSTLLAIVTELGLVDTLRGVDKATVFAPSDAAFAKIPADVLASLTLDDKKAIVARHVIPGYFSGGHFSGGHFNEGHFSGGYSSGGQFSGECFMKK